MPVEALREVRRKASAIIETLAGELDETVPHPERSTGTVTSRLRTGQVRAFGTCHVHDVTATGPRPAVSLHVYSPRLLTMTRYRLDEQGTLLTVAHEQAGVDW